MAPPPCAYRAEDAKSRGRNIVRGKIDPHHPAGTQNRTGPSERTRRGTVYPPMKS